MKLVIGLGNPGKEYEHTRHNVGFDFIDFYLKKNNFVVNWSNKFDSLYCQILLFGEKVIFLKPQTYMNLSGNAVHKCCEYYNISVDDILVISDDLDLTIGNFKLKQSGSCGGHNGLRDIELKIKSDKYKRLKIGISNNKNIDTKNYVLSKISVSDKEVLDNLFNYLVDLINDYFILSFDILMNKYNRKNR